MHLPKLRKCWLLICIQLVLISIFLLVSVLFDTHAKVNLGGVKFVHQHVLTTATTPSHHRELHNVGNFTRNFALIRLNDGYTNHEKVCFREGTRNDTRDIEGSFNPVCSCSAEWHGKDCGQPEVLWRAFMTTTRQALNLSAPRKVPHNVFYIISTNGFSLQTLEIQMSELSHVVDFFVLCDMDTNSPAELQGRDFHLSYHTNTGFLKQYQDRVLLMVDKLCGARQMYKHLKAFLPAKDFRRDDVVVYSRANEILSHRAINFFKWYDNWPQPVKFRLKYNVFGFFWQHPQSTMVGSVAATIGMLEDSFKSDPNRLLAVRKPGLIVGDLNHFGGWYCEYCAQSIDIVRQITWQSHRNTGPVPPQKAIDSDYIQNLIVNGLYVDGKLGLIQLRRYQEKYYCPDYVSTSSWKFDNLVINIFAKWEEDYEN